MELPVDEVIDILGSKKVTGLFHANTVLTSCNFLQHSALLGRGIVEQSGGLQSPQLSDSIDKKFGLWFDVFVDSCDLHQRMTCRNKFGPVSFEFDLSILESIHGGVWVTRKNPIEWPGLDPSLRWYSTLEELQRDFKKGQACESIVFRHQGGKISFGNHLKAILVDDPDRVANDKYAFDIKSLSVGALQISALQGGVDPEKIELRSCVKKCKCKNEYSNLNWKVIKRCFGI